MAKVGRKFVDSCCALPGLCTGEVTLFSDTVLQSATVVRKLLRISFSFRSAARNSTTGTILLFSASKVRVINDNYISKELSCYFRQWKCAQTIRDLDKIRRFLQFGAIGTGGKMS